ncbi:MAG: hypothetical protein PHD81_04395 [Candidatus Nanoarchaeia archaeon]|nr:hypothetical protein [Candidatus Nanoarchaeia archaeon]MDD5588318.1 hypothetical protein [Candidatus Nanoarchaeia archaeon]
MEVDNETLKLAFDNLDSDGLKTGFLEDLLKSNKDLPKEFCCLAKKYLSGRRNYLAAAEFAKNTESFLEAAYLYRKGGKIEQAIELAKSSGLEDVARQFLIAREKTKSFHNLVGVINLLKQYRDICDSNKAMMFHNKASCIDSALMFADKNNFVNKIREIHSELSKFHEIYSKEFVGFWEYGHLSSAKYHAEKAGEKERVLSLHEEILRRIRTDRFNHDTNVPDELTYFEQEGYIEEALTICKIYKMNEHAGDLLLKTKGLELARPFYEKVIAEHEKRGFFNEALKVAKKAGLTDKIIYLERITNALVA